MAVPVQQRLNVCRLGGRLDGRLGVLDSVSREQALQRTLLQSRADCRASQLLLGHLALLHRLAKLGMTLNQLRCHDMTT